MADARREVVRTLRLLVEGVRPLLGENFVGAYLHGSWAVGDADESSDLDFIIVVREDVPPPMVASLQAEHVRVYELGSYWAQHLEGSYFPKAWLPDLSTVGKPLLYVDNGSRVLERSAHDNSLVVRWVFREHSVTLEGPEPRDLLGPVPADALRLEVLTVMHAWAKEILADPEKMNNAWYQPYAVLSYCRMLHTLATGRVQSKPAGARWATSVLDKRWQGLIERSWTAHAGQFTRVGQKADPEDFQSTLGFIQSALDEGESIWSERN